MRMQRLTPTICIHLMLALLLCYTAAVAAAGKEREHLHHVNEARNFQSSRLPRRASSSINEDRYSHSLKMASSSSNEDRYSHSLKGKAVPKIPSMNYSRKYSKVPVNQNILSNQEPRLRVYRRRRRKKRPGVFLVPTTVVGSISFNGVTNFASASLSSSQTSAKTFTFTSSESITTTPEKVNKTQAAELMKQQYHKFRSLLPGGKSEDNDTESSGISEALELSDVEHISRSSFHSRATILNGFKQQRSARENSGISQSGKLPSSLQAFFPADLLLPIIRIPEQLSPENLDANSTGSIDTIARILEERLGPGSSNNYDPSILVDFLALIALTRPALDTRPAQGNQIPGVLGLNRRRGGDIAGRLSQRHASLRPLVLAQQLQVDPTKIRSTNTNAKIRGSATNNVNANNKDREILRKDGPNPDSEIILAEYRNEVQLKDSNSAEGTKSVDEFVGRALSSIKQKENFDGVSKFLSKSKSLTESNVPPENTANTQSQLERATSKLEAPLLFSDIEELQKSPESEVEMERRNEPNFLYPDSLNIQEVNNPADITNSSGPVVTNENSEFGPFSDGNDPNAGVSPPALPPVLRASLYSYLIPRLMSLAPLTETIPGVPGLDYPIMSTLPYTNFYCSNMPWPGFYADTEARCQAWHLCDLDGRQASFLCPNGTIFNQAFMVCDWWYNYDCQEAPYLYPLNERLFQMPELPPPTQQHRTLTAHVLDTLFI